MFASLKMSRDVNRQEWRGAPMGRQGASGVSGPHRSDPVPYIAEWSAERAPGPRVVAKSRGIGYADERPYDRDTDGVLWARVRSLPGRGRPQFGKVHALRQRRAMGTSCARSVPGPPTATRMGCSGCWARIRPTRAPGRVISSRPIHRSAGRAPRGPCECARICAPGVWRCVSVPSGWLECGERSTLREIRHPSRWARWAWPSMIRASTGSGPDSSSCGCVNSLSPTCEPTARPGSPRSAQGLSSLRRSCLGSPATTRS